MLKFDVVETKISLFSNLKLRLITSILVVVFMKIHYSLWNGLNFMLEMKLELETKEYLQARLYLKNRINLAEIELLDKNELKIDDQAFKQFKFELVEYVIINNKNPRFSCRTEDRDFMHKHTIRFMQLSNWDTCFLIHPWSLLRAELLNVYSLCKVNEILECKDKNKVRRYAREIVEQIDEELIKLLVISYTRANLVLLNREQQQNAALANKHNYKFSDYIDSLTIKPRSIRDANVSKLVEYNGFENIRHLDLSLCELFNRQLLFEIFKVRGNYFTLVESKIKSINTQFALVAQSLVDLRLLTIMYDCKRQYVTVTYILRELQMKPSNHKTYKVGLDALLKYKVLTNEHLVLPLVLKSKEKRGNNNLYKINSIAINVLEDNEGKIICN